MKSWLLTIKILTSLCKWTLELMTEEPVITASEVSEEDCVVSILKGTAWFSSRGAIVDSFVSLLKSDRLHRLL